MCWKEEWAFAIRDITKAIQRIEKAKKKLEGRRDRAQKSYDALYKDKRHRSVNALTTIQESIKKWNSAIKSCKRIIKYLEFQQHNLRFFIEKYGINLKTKGSERVQKILKETFG